MSKKFKVTSLILIAAMILSLASISFAENAEKEVKVKKTNYLDERSALVFLTDFGVKDGAVSAMKGVSFQVDPDLKMFDLTHEIPNFNIWEGSYRLKQTAKYWPEGTVFVCVVDPGVGTNRKSVVVKTKTGHYFVGPDNGLFGLIQEEMGIEEVREIDESKNRLKGSEKSHTFHGRDVYAYTGARLASKAITYKEVGTKLEPKVRTIPYQKATFKNNSVAGNIPILDTEYGNVWSNIPDSLFQKLNPKYEDIFEVEIFNKDKSVYKGKMPFVKSFGEVEEGKPLIYINELLDVSVALNMDNFAKVNNVEAGSDWTIKISKIVEKAEKTNK